ncbi:TPA: phage tail sheath family protein [Salmonella enterica subsp. enterica serovar Ball]|nr:phage tail sheath family protein [Salmonella enterica subsp. enterica serovar Ball]HCA3488354.1 phage tail sheath family protein [Salmonella enterica subsp. enterica serovar Ball]HCA3563324.1 phage tail sheath family protein [Salmonella enterica subsp. enterica serovar Ball]HCA3581726.1 phage tail sheath family protein [Salmonella enterica subsp. enterica serovar Ball]
MAMILPGVSYDETLLTQASGDDPVTMPLFIGYTSDAVKPDTTMQPVSVGSLTQASSLFGQRGTLAYSLRHFFENGGRQCYVLSLGQGQGEPASRLHALIAALQAPQMLETLLADDKTGLVLVPELSELNEVNAAEVDVNALWYQGWQALLTLCRQTQQRFALLELPDSPARAVTLTRQPFSADLCQRGAAWWPRLETSYEDEASAPVVLSSLPAVAAAIQHSAHDNGIWKAPANLPLARTRRPTRSILTSQALLNNQGVSCNLIRSFVGKGVRLWGCRTLLNEENTAWRYIQTRLLVSSVEHYLCKLARAYLFEPNTAPSWMKLKGQVWTWLRQQWLAGAFFGTVEEEAFSLSIGLDESMTEDDIRQGKMILQVRLALLAPAEFIDISLTLDLRDGTARAQTGG